MLNLIEAGLVTDDELGGEALVAYISSVDSTNGVTDRGRACELELTITVEAHNG